MAAFRRNPAFHAEIRSEPEFTAHMRATATQVAVQARAGAPVHTRYYRRHIRPDGTHVVAGDPFSHLVEWGSANNPPYAPLRRGVRAAGLRLDEINR